MTLYRHAKRFQSDSVPTLDLVILLNPVKDNAFIYFELKNGEWPIKIHAKTGGIDEVFEFSNGNNTDHFVLLKKLKPAIDQDSEFELTLSGRSYPLWSGEKEQSALKSVIEDYYRLLEQTN